MTPQHATIASTPPCSPRPPRTLADPSVDGAGDHAPAHACSGLDGVTKLTSTPATKRKPPGNDRNTHERSRPTASIARALAG